MNCETGETQTEVPEAVIKWVNSQKKQETHEDLIQKIDISKVETKWKRIFDQNIGKYKFIDDISGLTVYEQPEGYDGPTDNLEKDSFESGGGVRDTFGGVTSSSLGMNGTRDFEETERLVGESVLDKYTNVLRQQTNIVDETVPFSADCEL